MNTPASPVASTDGRGFQHLIFPPDSSNRVQHYTKRDGVWSGLEKFNQDRFGHPTLLDCSDMQEELDKVFAKYAPAPVVAPAEPFVAPAPEGRVISVCNEHVLNEWSRMATQAYKAGHNEIGHKFSAAATISAGTKVCPKWFDSMQEVYREWLVFGWSAALPAFEKHFPAEPAESSDADKVTKSIGSVLLSYRPTSKGRHLVFCSIRTPGAVGNSSHVTSKMRATGRKALPRSGFCYLVA